MPTCCSAATTVQYAKCVISRFWSNQRCSNRVHKPWVQRTDSTVSAWHNEFSLGEHVVLFEWGMSLHFNASAHPTPTHPSGCATCSLCSSAWRATNAPLAPLALKKRSHGKVPTCNVSSCHASCILKTLLLCAAQRLGVHTYKEINTHTLPRGVGPQTCQNTSTWQDKMLFPRLIISP